MHGHPWVETPKAQRAPERPRASTAAATRPAPEKTVPLAPRPPAKGAGRWARCVHVQAKVAPRRREAAALAESNVHGLFHILKVQLGTSGLDALQ